MISGINGGPNLAEAWLGSGTIGAARIAAFAGIPALSVSGIDEEDPESDVALLDQRYIVITPMRADEHHEVLLDTLASQVFEIPTPGTDPARE